MIALHWCHRRRDVHYYRALGVGEEFPAFITRELDTIAVKGKAAGVRVYELVGAKEVFEDGSDCRPQEQMVGTVVTLCGNPKIVPHIEKYESALKCIREQRFIDAIPLLNEVNDAIDDKPSQLWLERCAAYIEDPPPANWDGVYRPKTK